MTRLPLETAHNVVTVYSQKTTKSDTYFDQIFLNSQVFGQ